MQSGEKQLLILKKLVSEFIVSWNFDDINVGGGDLNLEM
jgi:hypothetical protein